MGHPVLVARLRVTNDGGTFDSLSNGPEQPRIVWETKHTLGNEPNTARIGIYNLAPDTVAKIQGVVKIRREWTPGERAALLLKGASTEPFEVVTDSLGLGQVELFWGFADSENLSRDAIEAALALGFSGQITDGPRVVRQGNDLITTMLCQDAGETLGAAEVVQEAGQGAAAFEGKSYAAGTKVSEIIGDLVNSIGISVDVGKVETLLVAALAARGLPAADAKTFAGYNASGPARPQIERFLSSLDLRWSIYNGELFIFADGETLPGIEPLELSTARANVIGQPEVSADGTQVSTQATTRAIPGRRCQILTDSIAQAYRIDEAATRGDTLSGGLTTLRGESLQTLVDTL